MLSPKKWIRHWLRWAITQSLATVAKRNGFLDPVVLLQRLRGFTQPSEVGEPVELLRAGAIFHARGLINTRAFQYNLDWAWPYWVRRQFNPEDPSFVPRAFSFSHVNLSHRNWTAIGIPDGAHLPIVDPAGTLTPFFDGYSLEFWWVTPKGLFLPSQSQALSQTLNCTQGLSITTEMATPAGLLQIKSEYGSNPDAPHSPTICEFTASIETDSISFLALVVRPYNPEGIAFIDHIEWEAANQSWKINQQSAIRFDRTPVGQWGGNHAQGDVWNKFQKLFQPDFFQKNSASWGSAVARQAEGRVVECDAGLATAAVLFQLEPGPQFLRVFVDLKWDAHPMPILPLKLKAPSWESALQETPVLQIPDPHQQFLYEVALRTLVLHCPCGLAVPGPYTYRRFWFRDAAFMVDALLAMGLETRAESIVKGFKARQTKAGYFLSQEGEWDSNGEALWILNRYFLRSHKIADAEEMKSVHRAAQWILKKRVKSHADRAIEGLMPAGFSAEHLGPNDHYYWDAFWSEAGLRAAARLCDRQGDRGNQQVYLAEAENISSSITNSIRIAQSRRDLDDLWPASPNRRFDAGAIGSLVADYPLRLTPAGHPPLVATAKALIERCLIHGGFFQDMIHSGVNAYLTLHLSQVLLRAGDPEFEPLVKAVAALASPTGQWPEAIHPHSRGGCMGDGQHAWAAAEWLLMMRNRFVYEEGENLILGAGISKDWLMPNSKFSFGPAKTDFGILTMRYTVGVNGVSCHYEANWGEKIPSCTFKLPRTHCVTLTLKVRGEVFLKWDNAASLGG